MKYKLIKGKDAVTGLMGIIVVASLIIAGSIALLRVLDGSTDLKVTGTLSSGYTFSGQATITITRFAGN